MKKKAKFTSVLAALLVFTNLCASAATMNVRLVSLTKEDKAMNVDFPHTAPVTVGGVSMVPIRTVCEDAGMEVIWKQKSKAVVVKLNANSDSDMPVEQHAYELLAKKASSLQQTISPECISLTMYLGSEEARLHYNYTDLSNNTVSFGKSLTLSRDVSMTGNGTMVAPLRSVFTNLGLGIEWEEKQNIVKIEIPEMANYSEGLEAVEAYDPNGEEKFVAKESEAFGAVEEPEDNRVYIGNFRISHYCPCSKCNGSYGAVTAWAGALKPGQTIAVDPSVIGKLSTVEIDGYGIRVAEDCGGAIKGNRIDVAVSSHEEAMRLGVVYRDVWLIK